MKKAVEISQDVGFAKVAVAEVVFNVRVTKVVAARDEGVDSILVGMLETGMGSQG